MDDGWLTFARGDDAERRWQIVSLAGDPGRRLAPLLKLCDLIIRPPKGVQAVTGRSRCDHCSRELRPLELVPILSRLWLRGRCPACGARIDPLHWQVEACAAVIGLLSVGLAPDASGLAVALFGWLLLPLGWLDWRHYWLPNKLVLPLAAAGLALGGLLGPRSSTDYQAWPAGQR